MYRSMYSWLQHWLEASSQLHPRGRYSLDWRLGGPQSPVWKVWKREKSCPYRNSNSDLSAVQHIPSRNTDWAIASIRRFYTKCRSHIWVYPAFIMNGQISLFSTFDVIDDLMWLQNRGSMTCARIVLGPVHKRAWLYIFFLLLNSFTENDNE
jgi:hypothetical protein